MHTLATTAFAPSKKAHSTLITIAIALALTFMLTCAVQAGGTTGAALKPAFDMLNDIVAGYGTQLLVLVGFVAAAFAVMAVNATGAILKFIGFVIFLAVGLGAAIGLSGAVI